MEIAIIGCGNSGCAHAAKLTQAGHSVRLLKTSHSLHETNFERVVESGGIQLHDLDGTKQFIRLPCVTRDPERAVLGAQVVLVLTQTMYHAQVASMIAPFVKQAEMVLVVPGYMGSVYFQKAIGTNAKIYAEGESTAYDARILEDGTVRILFKNVRNALAFQRSDQREPGLAVAGRLVDTYRHFRTSIVESALHNPNLIVHTIGTIMSASRIEYSQGEFWMYREAFTPSIWNVVNRLDAEKMAILSRLGCEPIRYLDACKFRNEVDMNVDALAVFQGYAKSGGPKGPASVNSRYVYEDVPMGLCLMSSIGAHLGIKTPVCDALISLGGALLGTDFRQTGRTLETLGVRLEDIRA